MVSESRNTKQTKKTLFFIKKKSLKPFLGKLKNIFFGKKMHRQTDGQSDKGWDRSTENTVPSKQRNNTFPFQTCVIHPLHFASLGPPLTLTNRQNNPNKQEHHTSLEAGGPCRIENRKKMKLTGVEAVEARPNEGVRGDEVFQLT